MQTLTVNSENILMHQMILRGEKHRCVGLLKTSTMPVDGLLDLMDSISAKLNYLDKLAEGLL